MLFAQTTAAEPDQKKTLFFAFILVTVTVIIFREAASAMFDAWQQEEYSHGYLVPLIALLLLFNKMNDEQITPQSSWLGLSLVATCVITQFIFQLAGVKGLQPQIFLLSLIGLFILFYGLKASRAVTGPLLIVLFAAPLPKLFYYTMSFKMQMMSTTIGTMILRLFGISVFQDGNIIDLGSYQLQVVEACNGLRYLFPLMCLGFMLAYMYKASPLKRAILFVSTVPITIVMNSLRIAMIGLTVDLWGTQMAEGFLHDFEGWIVFMGCAVILLLEIGIMNRIGTKGKIDFESIRLPSLKSLPLPKSGMPSKAAAVFFGFALLVNVVPQILFPSYIQPVTLRQPFSTFPMQLGDWTGSKGTLDDKVLAVLGTNEYLIADYAKVDEPNINLYVLYYPKQDSTSNQAVHSPSVCIPAGGWTVESSITKTITLQHDIARKSSQLAVNRLMTTKGETRQLVYYWFIQDGQSIANANSSRLAAIKNAIFKGHTNGAMIRLIAPIHKGRSEKETEDSLIRFMGDNLTKIYMFMFFSDELH